MILSFDRPWLLLLVPLCVWLSWWSFGRVRRQQVELAAALGPRAGRLVSPRSMLVAPSWAGAVAAGAALVALVLALAGPRAGAVADDREPQPLDLVVCLDVSRSMLARDVAPSRLEAGRRAIVRLTERARGDRIGLVAFAGDARLIVPRTTDGATLVELLAAVDEFSVGRGGTDLQAALERGAAALAGATPAPGVIVMITDGEDDGDRGRAAAAACRGQGVIVHVLACGTARGSKIPVPVAGGEAWLRDAAGNDVVTAPDEAALRALAAAGGGVFARCDADGAAVDELYAGEIAPLARTASVAAEGWVGAGNRYRWPLGLAFALLFWRCAGRRPRR